MIEKCQECFKIKKNCECFEFRPIQFTEEKDHTPIKESKKVPDVRIITKGIIGERFVESIIYENKPCFLVNHKGRIERADRIEYEDVIYQPREANGLAYEPYSYSKLYLDLLINNPPSKEDLLDSIKLWIDEFIDTTPIDKHLILGDLLLSYSQEWIDTLHFLYCVGETESGKSTILHLFKNLGYRVMYGEDIPNADIYNFLGTDEEACGTICEDEAQDIGKNKEKIRTYKNSYSRGSTKARVVNADNSRKKQIFHKTFCLKLFAGEKLPNDKGFNERLAVLYMREGSPKSNIKRMNPDQKDKLRTLRNKLLFYKVYNHFEGLDKIESGLTKRDQELFEDYLRVMSNTKYFEESQITIQYYTKQRHERIWNSIEARIFKTLIHSLNDDFTIHLENYWLNMVSIDSNNTDLAGSLEKESFYVYEFALKITRNYLAKLFTEKFQASKTIHDITKDKKIRRIRKYHFDPDTIQKLASKYNVKDLPLFISGHSGHSGQSRLKDNDNHDNHDNSKQHKGN